MDFVKEKASYDHFQIVKVIEEKHDIQMKEFAEQHKNLVIILLL
jgi:hypothetical protein